VPKRDIVTVLLMNLQKAMD
jgi:hypothetical protein